MSTEIVFLFYEGMTPLDAIGPHEVLSRLPGAQIKRVAPQDRHRLVKTDTTQLTLVAEYSLREISSADVLVIPGAREAATFEEQPKILEWIRAIHETTRWTTSVCTGSLILGAAGLLKGLPATSHWSVIGNLEKYGAAPTAERVVESGKIMTSAGVSAGMDMALLLVSKLGGEEVAKRIQLGIEYDPKPPFDCGSVTKAPPEMVQALLAAFKSN